jgi:hypothetical protein
MLKFESPSYLKYMMIEAQTNGKLKSRNTILKWVIEIVKED